MDHLETITLPQSFCWKEQASIQTNLYDHVRQIVMAYVKP